MLLKVIDTPAAKQMGSPRLFTTGLLSPTGFDKHWLHAIYCVCAWLSTDQQSAPGWQALHHPLYFCRCYLAGSNGKNKPLCVHHHAGTLAVWPSSPCPYPAYCDAVNFHPLSAPATNRQLRFVYSVPLPRQPTGWRVQVASVENENPPSIPGCSSAQPADRDAVESAGALVNDVGDNNHQRIRSSKPI